MFEDIIQKKIDDFINMKIQKNQISDAQAFKGNLRRFKIYIIQNKPYIKFISDIDRKDIEDYIKYLRETDYRKLKIKYRNSFVYRNIRDLYKFLEYLTIIEENKENMPKVGLIKRSDFPSPNRRTVKHFPRWFDDYLIKEIRLLSERKGAKIKFKTMILCIYYTGLRVYDLATLEQDCLIRKLDRNWIRIFSNKMKRYYEIPINDELYTMLIKYKEMNKESIEKFEEKIHPTTGEKVKFLFTVNDPKVYKDTIARRIKVFNENAIKKAGVEGYSVSELEDMSLTSHKFRHNIGIKLTRVGADPLLVAEFLGHGNLAMAQAYIQEDENEINEILNELIEDGTLENHSLDNSEEILIIDKRNISENNDVISKVTTGWCVHFNGNTMCESNPYECWLCDNLKPDYENKKYIDYLVEQRNIHKELLERNTELGFKNAIDIEEKILIKINSFMEEVNGKCLDIQKEMRENMISKEKWKL